MLECPSCSRPVSEDSHFCSSCGAAVLPDVGATVEQTLESRTPTPQSRGQAGRFDPGDRVGTRYRIVALLGRGGMGEVYRADDLELGQSVALKFLPTRVSGDSAEIERFRREVRVARGIAHPNICRTYDIAEENGHVFLVMEYVDGEDLASVLRRLGRPSRDKAVEIARQLCLGVAAAHENDVLHRDLKPANVMIDGRGRVRVTDFGLAGMTEELATEAVVAGTPSYMAPEQLNGKPATTQSDLYALGLVLYEVFTGKRVHDTTDVVELRKRHSDSSVTTPSSFNEDIDPAVERVILQCLETDPAARPSSAYTVLGALPGGDPLAAALAAGETPSPELVASAGGAGSVSPRVAMLAAAFFAVSIGGLTWWKDGRHQVLPEPSSALTLRAEQVLAAAGIVEPPRYSANGFLNSSHTRLGGEAPGYLYWHRWSPRTLVHPSMHIPRASLLQPPQAFPGSATCVLDAEGRLLALQVVPSPTPPEPGATEIDWAALLALATNPTTVRSTSASQVPAIIADTLVAWSGDGIEYVAAAAAGRVLHFSLIADWGSTHDLTVFEPEVEASGSNPPWGVFLATTLIPMVVTLWLAWHNLRSGRGDLRGAFTLTGIVMAAYMAESLFSLDVGEVGLLTTLNALTNGNPLGHALLHGTMIWFAYVAFEPYVRRWWPRVLVSWARLVSGRARDPIVGRDILVGGILASASIVVHETANRLGASLGLTRAADSLEYFELMAITDPALSVSIMSRFVALAALTTMLYFTQLFVCRLILRSNRAALVATTLLYGLLNGFYMSFFASMELPIALPQGVVYASLVSWVAVRFGFLAVLVAAFLRFLLLFIPLTLDPGVWYAGHALPPAIVIVGLLVFGLVTALAGQSVFRDPLDESARPAG